ncbi:MAG: outer membrane protein assembly factor BamE domain-containing protein [Armatimonadota bacterium]
MTCRLCMVIVLLCGIFVLSGCGTKPPIVTQEELDQLQVGMTYSQVVTIIGVEGKEKPIANSANIPDYAKGATVYQWINADKSSAQVVFDKDGKLLSKSSLSQK